MRKLRVLVCRGPTCGDQRNSAPIHEAISRHMDSAGLGGYVIMDWQSCFGQCQKGPNMLLRESRGPEDKLALAVTPMSGVKAAFYSALTPERGCRLVDRHLVAWDIVPEAERTEHLKLVAQMPTRSNTLPPGGVPAVQSAPSSPGHGKKDES